MKLQYIVIWLSKPILQHIHDSGTTNGKLLRRCRHNLRQMAPFWEDILAWFKSDAEENDYELAETLDKLPWKDEGFVARFNAFLVDDEIEYTPYRFSEELLDYVEGITGEGINRIAWLFEENAPKEDGDGLTSDNS